MLNLNQITREDKAGWMNVFGVWDDFSGARKLVGKFTYDEIAARPEFTKLCYRFQPCWSVPA